MSIHTKNWNPPLPMPLLVLKVFAWVRLSHVFFFSIRIRLLTGVPVTVAQTSRHWLQKRLFVLCGDTFRKSTIPLTDYLLMYTPSIWKVKLEKCCAMLKSSRSQNWIFCEPCRLLFLQHTDPLSLSQKIYLWSFFRSWSVIWSPLNNSFRMFFPFPLIEEVCCCFVSNFATILLTCKDEDDYSDIPISFPSGQHSNNNDNNYAIVEASEDVTASQEALLHSLRMQLSKTLPFIYR